MARYLIQDHRFLDSFLVLLGAALASADTFAARLRFGRFKRQKNDAADAEAICEAAQRPSMRFVAVKTEEQQANGIVFRARDLLVRQRTQCVNALRGHLTEYGHVFPKGITHVETLVAVVEDLQSSLPDSARVILKLLSTPSLHWRRKSLHWMLRSTSARSQTRQHAG